MANPDFPLLEDDDMDDLPRTLRREKAAREAQERAEGRIGDERNDGRSPPAPEFGAHMDPNYAGQAQYDDEELVAAEVQRFNPPFLHMMVFFLKAVVAAIPALILLGAIVWLAGEILQAYFPWLLQMRIVILFPE